MSINFSRRHCLKLISGTVALSLLPLQFSYAGEASPVFVITNGESIEQAFINAIKRITPVNTLRISSNNYDNLISIKQLPANSILIGLVNDAEKVLIDSMLHDRQALITTTNRVNKTTATDQQVADLATTTTNIAFTNLNKIPAGTVTSSQNKNGSLISFYAQL